jgi:hypothetical protein
LRERERDEQKDRIGGEKEIVGRDREREKRKREGERDNKV